MINADEAKNALIKLTLNLLNFLNEIIHFPFLKLFIIIFRNIKIGNWNWSVNSIEPGQQGRQNQLSVLPRLSHSLYGQVEIFKNSLYKYHTDK